MRARLHSTALLSVLALSALPAPAHATSTGADTTPVRLGNNTEGAALVTSGPLAQQVAVLDGDVVLAVPIAGRGRDVEEAFSVAGIPWGAFPSGLAYLPVEKRFAFGDQGDPDVLVVTDAAGRLHSTREISYPAGSLAVLSTESMVYLDDDSAYPDSIARVVFLEDASTAIQILDRQGVLRREISVTGLPEDDSYAVGLAERDGGAFLVGTNAGIWKVSPDGAVAGSATVVPGAGGPEGLLSLPNGRVYAAGYSQGALVAFDRALRRDASRDRGFPIGVGLSRSFDGFWDRVTGRYVLLGLSRDGLANEVASLAPDLASKHSLFRLPPGFASGLSAGPGTAVATCSPGRTGIDEYARDGTPVTHVPFPTAVTRPCRALTYLSGLDAYAVRLFDPVNRSQVLLISRSGELLRTITTGPLPVADVEVAPDDPATLLVWGRESPSSPWTLVRYDGATGGLVGSGTPGTGRLRFPSRYLAGPAGSYALLNPFTSEIVRLVA